MFLPTGLWILGCASPGTPRPPSLHLPEVVSNMAAERVGDTVRLHWTVPSKTTDGLEIKSEVTAQVCRAAAASACSPIHRQTAKPGPAEMLDVLPPALLREAGTVLTYRVELLNRAGRSAGLSPAALVAGGAAPPPVADLRVETARAGALLQWRPEDAADAVELERSQVGPAAKPKQQKTFGPGNAEPAVVHLRADKGHPGAAPFTPDAGGMLDATAVRGQTYTYTAQRVRHVVLDGRALELRSAVSPPVTVTLRDVFPPQAPTGLEAVAGESGGVVGIDLSWTPNTEDDLAGYIIYRRELPDGKEARLTPALVPQPAFRDTDVVLGRVYIYTVVAVDSAGNQSPPSQPAHEYAPRP